MKKIIATIQATVEKAGEGEIKLTCGYATPEVEGLGYGPEALEKLLRDGDLEAFVGMAVAKRMNENLKNAKDVLTTGFEDAVQEGIGAHKGLTGLRDGVLPVIGAAIAEAIDKALKKDEAKPEAPAETPTQTRDISEVFAALHEEAGLDERDVTNGYKRQKEIITRITRAAKAMEERNPAEADMIRECVAEVERRMDEADSKRTEPPAPHVTPTTPPPAPQPDAPASLPDEFI